jgi:hypothetical protein
MFIASSQQRVKKAWRQDDWDSHIKTYQIQFPSYSWSLWHTSRFLFMSSGQWSHSHKSWINMKEFDSKNSYKSPWMNTIFVCSFLNCKLVKVLSNRSILCENEIGSFIIFIVMDVAYRFMLYMSSGHFLKIVWFTNKKIWPVQEPNIYLHHELELVTRATCAPED